MLYRRRVNGSHQSDHAARNSGPGVAGGGRIVEHPPAEVVLVGVHDEAAAENGVGPRQGDDFVLELERGHATGRRLDVAEVPNVADLVVRSAVRFLLGVVVRAETSTTLPQISLLVNVEPMLVGACVVPLQSRHESFHGDSSVLMLDEGDVA